MAPAGGEPARPETQVTVRYWASARAAVGVPEEIVALPGPVTLDRLLAAILERHADVPGLGKVLRVCSVLVDGAQLRTQDPATAEVHDGASVEFLPPFAGG